MLVTNRLLYTALWSNPTNTYNCNKIHFVAPVYARSNAYTIHTYTVTWVFSILHQIPLSHTEKYVAVCRTHSPKKIMHGISMVNSLHTREHLLVCDYVVQWRELGRMPRHRHPGGTVLGDRQHVWRRRYAHQRVRRCVCCFFLLCVDVRNVQNVDILWFSLVAGRIWVV